MNINLMTIDNMLFSAASFADHPATHTLAQNNSTHFSLATNSPSHPDNPESITTDKKPTVAQNEYIDKPKHDFKLTLQKTEEIEPNRQNQNNKESDKQLINSEIPLNANPAQSISNPEIPITSDSIVKENAAKIELKTGHQLSQLIAKLKDSNSPAVTEQGTKSNEIDLLVTTKNSQFGIKNVLPETSKGQTELKNGLHATSRNQFGLKTALSNISKQTPVNDIHPGKTKNEEKVLISNTTVETIKTANNTPNTKYLLSDALVDTNGSKIVNSEKTSTLGTSFSNNSNTSATLSGKKLETEVLVDNNIKTTNDGTALTEKSAINIINEKTLEPNANFQQAQNKFNKQDSHSIEISPEKSINNVNRTPDSKTTNLEEITESSDSNRKEISITGKQFSANSAVQEINITNVQVSSAKIKNNNSTNSGNKNSELEQVLTNNNHNAPATTQSSGSAEGAKTLDMSTHTSTSSNSASISKQIFESVQSSFSQEGRNQQITVQLNPPELGKVSIKFQEQDKHITGLLEVSKTQTRIEIEQAIPQIIRDLQNSGIQIKRLDVVLSQQEQSEQGTLREQTLQNGWARQQGSDDSYYTGDNNPDAAEINEWLINNNNYRNISELQEMRTANGSINMLI